MSSLSSAFNFVELLAARDLNYLTDLGQIWQGVVEPLVKIAEGASKLIGMWV